MQRINGLIDKRSIKDSIDISKWLLSKIAFAFLSLSVRCVIWNVRKITSMRHGKIVLVKRGLSLSLVLAFCLFSVSGMFHKLEITAGFLGGGIFWIIAPILKENNVSKQDNDFSLPWIFCYIHTFYKSMWLT